MTAYLVVLVLTPLWVFWLHWIAAHVGHYKNFKFPPLLVAAGAIILAYLLVGILAWQVYFRRLDSLADVVCAVIYGTLVFGGLAFSYFQCFGMTETARRIHILRALDANHIMTFDELRAEYGADTMLTVRLSRMVELNQLELRDGRYRVKKRLILRIGKAMAFWAKVLGFAERTGA